MRGDKVVDLVSGGAEERFEDVHAFGGAVGFYVWHIVLITLRALHVHTCAQFFDRGLRFVNFLLIFFSTSRVSMPDHMYQSCNAGAFLGILSGGEYVTMAGSKEAARKA